MSFLTKKIPPNLWYKSGPVLKNGVNVDYSGYKVFRSEWTDPVISQTVYDLLSKSESVNLWAPDELENVFDTMAADFMLSQTEAEKIQRILADAVF